MLDDVRHALQKEYQKQSQKGFCAELIDGYSGFIFMNRLGNVIDYTSIDMLIRRIIHAHNKMEIEIAKEESREPNLLPKFCVHVLRHTFCTRFCENEFNLKVIQEIMGHADISTTMFSHVWVLIK